MSVGNYLFILKSKSGFSFIEALLSMAVLSTVIFALIHINTLMSNESSDYSSKKLVGSLGGRIASGLQNTEVCGLMFKDIINQPISTYNAGTEHSITIYDETGLTILSQAGALVAPNYRILSSQIKFGSFEPFPPPLAPNPLFVTAEVTIIADRLVNPSEVSKVTIINKLLFQIVGAVYKKCSYFNDDESACQSIGGVWNISSTPMCKLRGDLICSTIGGTWNGTTCTY